MLFILVLLCYEKITSTAYTMLAVVRKKIIVDRNSFRISDHVASANISLMFIWFSFNCTLAV